jgi:hypothetical protein
MECWFFQRLAWLSYLISITAIAYSLIKQNANGAMAGLLLSYALTLDKHMILIYAVANLEGKMVSVERVANFMNI